MRKIIKYLIKKKRKKNINIKLYFMIFVLFYFLNSYFMINLINSYNIQYKLSLAIRASIFVIFYYFINKIM